MTDPAVNTQELTAPGTPVVTPLGASTIIISAFLANCFLGETMHSCGIFACCLTVCASGVLVSYAPNEAPLNSVDELDAWTANATNMQTFEAFVSDPKNDKESSSWVDKM